ncbi:MAG: 4-hydroxy-tetrahydrodipicolinate synthase [Bacteroidales bacterium]|nr:4-hydroxy-tetrahydrodipicolinate synthase [Bacteroidales bacterium]MDT8430947.1 4-hydroxy-tetrahydrodipicolinate synthase [Bacteroidales bacterium]
MANRADFRGTGVAMITPFKNDGSLNIEQLEVHTDRLIEKGVEYLVVLGTTAETPTLSKEEKLKIIEVTRKVNSGRVPMVVGAGGNSTEEVVGWIREIGTEGIDAYLSVAPYYNKPSQQGMKAHFSAIAASSELPLMLYNVPGRTGSNIAADTTLELAHELGSKIAAIKEASGDLSQIMRIIRDKPEGFQVVSGDDAITLAMISLGGSGVISVIGNALPDQFSSMVHDALAGDLDAAREKHYRVLPLIDLIFREGNPCGIKALMEVLGYGASNLRLPLIPATSALVRDLRSAAQQL